MVIENLNELKHFTEINCHLAAGMCIKGEGGGGAIASFPWIRI